MSSADDRENGKTTALPGLAGPLVRGMPIHELELAPGALCRTAANKLAAVTARAANAPTGLIHLAHAGRLWIAGGSGLPGGWEAMGPASARSTLAGWVIEQGVPMIVTDVLTDRRVPADAPMRGAGFRAYAGFPIHDRNDAIVGVCAVLDLRSRDWTVGELAGVDEGAQACTAFAEQQQASAEADRQRRFLDALLDSLRTGVAACDPDGRPVFTNAAMRAIADELPADADLETWLDRVPLADSNGIPVTADAAPLVRALRGERIRDAELRLRGPADRPVIMLADAQPITGLGGEPLGAVLTLRDVTEQRRASGSPEPSRPSPRSSPGPSTSTTPRRPWSRRSPRRWARPTRNCGWSSGTCWCPSPGTAPALTRPRPGRSGYNPGRASPVGPGRRAPRSGCTSGPTPRRQHSRPAAATPRSPCRSAPASRSTPS
ncbi:hypothetical protein GCM10020218_070160 [Dactylosporangium vinaceum]